MADRFSEFLKQWTAPTVLLSLALLVFGGIVWGIQINFTLVKLVESDAAFESALDKQKEYQAADRVSMAKITLVLDRLVSEVKVNRKAIAEHNTEAEKWKRRILLNEQRNHTND
jgi:hypothetical protein